MTITCMLCEADVTGMAVHACPVAGTSVPVDNQLWLQRRSRHGPVPPPAESVDAYLARVDGVVVAATLMREIAERLGDEIVDQSDRKAWVFRKPEPSA